MKFIVVNKDNINYPYYYRNNDGLFPINNPLMCIKFDSKEDAETFIREELGGLSNYVIDEVK